jgi:hypothetical protein
MMPAALSAECTGMMSLHGVWFPQEYIQSLRSSKSAFVAFDAIRNISQISIDTGLINGPSIMGTIAYNNHESASYLIECKTGGRFTVKPAEEYDMGIPEYYELELLSGSNQNPQLTVYTYSTTERTFQKEIFIRMSEIPLSPDENLQYMVNSLLFAGFYQIRQTGQFVRFTEDGRVTGLEDFVSYTVIADYTDTEGAEIDHIIFGNYFRNNRILAYKIRSYGLDLYAVKESRNGHILLQKLKYTLVRQ